MSTKTTDLTTMTPSEVDTLWLEALQPVIKLQRTYLEAAAELRRFEKRVPKGGRYYQSRYERGHRRPGETPEGLYFADLGYYITKRNAAYDAYIELKTKVEKPFDAEFDRRGGWTRYLLCANTNGHAHKPGCHTLGWETLVYAIPEVSGKTGDGVIATVGHTACTKCFPNAPVTTEADLARVAAADGKCISQNLTVTSRPGAYYRYGRCNDCGASVSITSTGKARKHKIGADA